MTSGVPPLTIRFSSLKDEQSPWVLRWNTEKILSRLEEAEPFNGETFLLLKDELESLLFWFLLPIELLIIFSISKELFVIQVNVSPKSWYQPGH